MVNVTGDLDMPDDIQEFSYICWFGCCSSYDNIDNMHDIELTDVTGAYTSVRAGRADRSDTAERAVHPRIVLSVTMQAQP